MEQSVERQVVRAGSLPFHVVVRDPCCFSLSVPPSPQSGFLCSELPSVLRAAPGTTAATGPRGTGKAWELPASLLTPMSCSQSQRHHTAEETGRALDKWVTLRPVEILGLPLQTGRGKNGFGKEISNPCFRLALWLPGHPCVLFFPAQERLAEAHSVHASRLRRRVSM